MMRLGRTASCGLGMALVLLATASAQGQSPGNQARAAEPRQSGAALRFAAVIMPARLHCVCPAVSGQVKEMLMEEGAHVEAGQVLARLERYEYELEYKHALTLVERARARLMEAEVKVKGQEEVAKQVEAEVQEATALRTLGEQRLERMRALLKSAAVEERLVSEAEGQVKAAQAREQQLQAKSKLARLEVQQSSLAVAKAELACAEVQSVIAKHRLDSTDVRAPASGTILGRHAEVGTPVGPGAGSGRSLTLYEIANLSDMEARIELPEQDIGQINLGRMCLIRTDAQPKVVYTGKVTRIRPTVSEQTRTVTVRIAMKIAPGQPTPRPGAYGQVEILLKE